MIVKNNIIIELSVYRPEEICIDILNRNYIIIDRIQSKKYDAGIYHIVWNGSSLKDFFK